MRSVPASPPQRVAAGPPVGPGHYPAPSDRRRKRYEMMGVVMVSLRNWPEIHAAVIAHIYVWEFSRSEYTCKSRLVAAVGYV